MTNIKETLIDLLTGYSLDTYEDVQYVADELIAKGVLPVVRCKDCKHWLKDVAGCTDNVGRCEWANYMVGAVGYCVYGERRRLMAMTELKPCECNCCGEVKAPAAFVDGMPWCEDCFDLALGGKVGGGNG